MTNVQKEDIHYLLKTFFNEKGLVRQHLDSYNEFIDHGLQEVVDEVAEIPIEVPESPYKVKLGQIWVIDPQSELQVHTLQKWMEQNMKFTQWKPDYATWRIQRPLHLK